MKLSYKAALMSALVAPGAGHYILKSYVKAAIFFSCTAFAIYMIMKSVVERANNIVLQIESGSVPLDVQSISELVKQSGASTDVGFAEYFPYVFIIVWGVAMLDAFRLGRALENQDPS